MCEDIYKFNASKRVSDLNGQSNILGKILNMLILILEMCCFISICTALYGVQVLPTYAGALHYMDDSCTQVVASALNHTLYFSHMWFVCMDIEVWFSRRCIRFSMMEMKSDNVVVRTIINIGIVGFHYVMGETLIQSRFKMKDRMC